MNEELVKIYLIRFIHHFLGYLKNAIGIFLYLGTLSRLPGVTQHGSS